MDNSAPALGEYSRYGYEGTSWGSGLGPVQAETIEQKAAAFVELRNEFLLYDDDDPRLAQAMKNLFFVFSDSEEFRSTMRTLQEGGPVNIVVGAEAGTSSFTPGTRTVTLDEMRARDPEIALATLAFELTNAALTPSFKAVEQQARAGAMSAREFGEMLERVEYRTAESVHRYYREAQRTLQRHGLGEAGKWLSKIDPASGEVRPMFETEDEALHVQRMTGHTGHYEQAYQQRWGR